MPTRKLNKANNLIILELLKPKFLNEIFSFCSINFTKKNWVDIKNINGNISNIIDGIFKKVKNIGIPIETSKSLKKFISSKIFNIKANVTKIKTVFTNVNKNCLLI